ncbi:MAG: polymer-forming cytoskeletal protein [Terriglobia bacterium]
MAFDMSKLAMRRREVSDLPEDWVGWLEPVVEVEGNMKVASGLIRLNARFKGDIISGGAVVVRDQGHVEGKMLPVIRRTISEAPFLGSWRPTLWLSFA